MRCKLVWRPWWCKSGGDQVEARPGLQCSRTVCQPGVAPDLRSRLHFRTPDLWLVQPSLQLRLRPGTGLYSTRRCTTGFSGDSLRGSASVILWYRNTVAYYIPYCIGVRYGFLVGAYESPSVCVPPLSFRRLSRETFFYSLT
eukprot:1509457-Rhodomonas_salina.3